jgi:hypothetical protein
MSFAVRDNPGWPALCEVGKGGLLLSCAALPSLQDSSASFLRSNATPRSNQKPAKTLALLPNSPLRVRTPNRHSSKLFHEERFCLLTISVISQKVPKHLKLFVQMSDFRHFSVSTEMSEICVILIPGAVCTERIVSARDRQPSAAAPSLLS